MIGTTIMVVPMCYRAVSQLRHVYSPGRLGHAPVNLLILHVGESLLYVYVISTFPSRYSSDCRVSYI